MDNFPTAASAFLNQMDEINRRKALPGEIQIASTAVEVCKRLKNVFLSFENGLNPDEEIGLVLTSYGAVRQIVVCSVVALGPNLLVISGIENSLGVTLVQHISQLSFLLVPVKKSAPDEPRRKIGFGEI